MFKIEYIPFERVPSDDPVSRFHQIWLEMAQAEKPVLWSRFKPFQYPEVLPHLAVFKRDSAGRYIYKIVGSELERLSSRFEVGFELGAGMPRDFVAHVRKEFQALREGSDPTAGIAVFPDPRKKFKKVYRALFGFAGDAGDIDTVIVVFGTYNEGD